MAWYNAWQMAELRTTTSVAVSRETADLIEQLCAETGTVKYRLVAAMARAFAALPPSERLGVLATSGRARGGASRSTPRPARRARPASPASPT